MYQLGNHLPVIINYSRFIILTSNLETHYDSIITLLRRPVVIGNAEFAFIDVRPLLPQGVFPWDDCKTCEKESI